MLKFPSLVATGAIISTLGLFPALAQDIAAGEKVFRKCKACHAVGPDAKNKVGPHLNNLIGRVAGEIEGYKYSKAMLQAGEEGLVWSEDKIAEFVTKPKDLVKKTKMSFAGLKKQEDRDNLLAYLATFSEAKTDAEAEKPAETDQDASKQPEGDGVIKTAALAKDAEIPTHGTFHLGRKALPEEVSAWDIDIRPDGAGLPEGSGSVSQGEPLYSENCAICHGDFGEGVDRWPVLAGGQGSLKEERPEKTIGSYWPYLSTVYDYVRRAMPFGNARSLSDDDVYAITAYLLYLNDIVTDEDFTLSSENFAEVRLPNEANFVADDRGEEAHHKVSAEPCMKDCKPDRAKILMRARVLDVTPDGDGEDGAAIE